MRRADVCTVHSYQACYYLGHMAEDLSSFLLGELPEFALSESVASELELLQFVLKESERTFTEEQTRTRKTTRDEVLIALAGLYSHAVVVPILGDGDCQFNSIVVGGGACDGGALLREMAVGWISLNEEQFKPFVDDWEG